MDHTQAVIVTLEEGMETRQTAWIEYDSGDNERGLSMIYIYEEINADCWYKAINAKSPQFVSLEMEL